MSRASSAAAARFRERNMYSSSSSSYEGPGGLRIRLNAPLAAATYGEGGIDLLCCFAKSDGSANKLERRRAEEAPTLLRKRLDSYRGDRATLAAYYARVLEGLTESLVFKVIGFLLDGEDTVMCACPERGGSSGSTASSCSLSLALCAQCGKASRIATRCRLNVNLLPPVGAQRPSAFKCCNFFAIDEHRRKIKRETMRDFGYHSFRTIVLDEWIYSGQAEYTLRIDQLTRGCLALGCVTPKAGVNTSLAWVAGGKPGYADAWGFVQEGLGSEADEVRVLSADTETFAGGPGSEVTGLLKRPLEAGTVVTIQIDATEGTFKIVNNGHTLCLTLPGDRPLAFAVALKFKDDKVELLKEA